MLKRHSSEALQAARELACDYGSQFRATYESDGQRFLGIDCEIDREACATDQVLKVRQDQSMSHSSDRLVAGRVCLR